MEKISSRSRGRPQAAVRNALRTKNQRGNSQHNERNAEANAEVGVIGNGADDCGEKCLRKSE